VPTNEDEGRKTSAFMGKLSMRLCITENDGQIRGEEVVVSRKTNMLDSLLVSYFTKRSRQGSACIMLQDESNDEPKFRSSYFTQDVRRGRSTTSVIDLPFKPFENTSWTPSSPTNMSTASGARSTKSDR
jgi:hypothetical protein